ncbi:hypothetical protein [Rhizobium sp.]|uniref:hypothetical protein n=1 Tax=Rhizobium sp. TaxID=391 RepID=UPI002F0AD26B
MSIFFGSDEMRKERRFRQRSENNAVPVITRVVALVLGQGRLEHIANSERLFVLACA